MNFQWRTRLEQDDDLSLFEPTLLNFLTQNLEISVKQANKFLNILMELIIKKERVGEDFRDLMEQIVDVLKKSIEQSNNNEFTGFIQKKYGQSLITVLQESQEQLAFDLGDEDDDFGLSRNQSSGVPASSSLTADKKHQNQNESKEYVGLSRRNLQSDSENESEDEGSQDRHYKRRIRRGRGRSGSQENRKRSRSRSNEKSRPNSRPNREANIDYDPLNTQQNSREQSLKMQQLGSMNNHRPPQQISQQMYQQMNPQQQQSYAEAQRNLWAMYNRNNPMLTQYQAQLIAASTQQQVGQQNVPGGGMNQISQSPQLMALLQMQQSLQPVPVQPNTITNNPILPSQSIVNTQEIQRQNSINATKQQQLLKSPNYHHQQAQAQQQQQSHQPPSLGIAGMSQQKMQSRKYSIYVKNIPDDINNIGDLNNYFQKFGNIHYINVDLNKKSALIKFKEIESAQKAAQSTETILNNPKIKVIYTVIEASNEDSLSPVKRQETAPPQIQPPTKPGNKTYESEEMVRKRKLIELKKEIEQQRKQLMEQVNNDLKAKIKLLNEEGITDQRKKEIEDLIDQDKGKLNALIKEEQSQKMKEKEEIKQQKIAMFQKKEQMNKPIDLILYDIGEKYRQFNSILNVLRQHGRVSDFKYTNEEKTQASVRFLSQTQNYLIEVLSKEGESQSLESGAHFKIMAKEDPKPSSQNPNSANTNSQSQEGSQQI